MLTGTVFGNPAAGDSTVPAEVYTVQNGAVRGQRGPPLPRPDPELLLEAFPRRWRSQFVAPVATLLITQADGGTASVGDGDSVFDVDAVLVFPLSFHDIVTVILLYV